MRRVVTSSVEISLDDLLRYIPDDMYLKIYKTLGILPEKAYVTYNENARCVSFMHITEDFVK